MSSSDESDLEQAENQQEKQDGSTSEKEIEPTNGSADKVVTWEDLVRVLCLEFVSDSI